MNRPFLLVLLLALGTLIGACGSAPVTPTEAPYRPTFSYAPAETGTPIDVSVGVIAPQFEGQGVQYWASNQTDSNTTGLVSGLRLGFRELLVATGFTVSGPFDSLEMMTFPEKRAADFVLYPIVDLDAALSAVITDQDARYNALTRTNTVTYSCDITASANGAIQIVAVEPLSGQLMWVRRVDVNTSPEVVSTSGAACQGAAGGDVRVQNAWARLHESLFRETMTALDRYVDGEEFQLLQEQARELRENTRY